MFLHLLLFHSLFWGNSGFSSDCHNIPLHFSTILKPIEEDPVVLEDPSVADFGVEID